RRRTSESISSRAEAYGRSRDLVTREVGAPSLVPSLLDEIIDRLTVGVFAVDLEMRIVVWNDFLALHSGRSSAEIIGKNLFETFPDLNRAWLERKIRHVADLKNMSFTSWQQRPYLLRLAHHRHLTRG